MIDLTDDEKMFIQEMMSFIDDISEWGNFVAEKADYLDLDEDEMETISMSINRKLGE